MSKMSEIKIISNKNIKENYFKMVLDASGIARKALPGQFVNIRVSDGTQPLLRRPLGIHRVTGHQSLVTGIELLFEVVGDGTRLLSQKKAGEYLDVIGPLGNGFSVLGSRFSVLVAGGMGVVPLLFLAERIIQGTEKRNKVNPVVLIGSKTKNGILCAKEFKALGCDVKVATEDGSQGLKGYVTGLLEDVLRHYPLPGTRYPIYACGPTPMLKEISRLSQEYKIPAQISLEAHMACGIGACLGCVVNTKEGFKRVCKEGPVFYAKEILWS